MALSTNGRIYELQRETEEKARQPETKLSASTLTCHKARLPGWAAVHRDAAKERAYRCVSSGLPFVPLSVESFGRLGSPALSLPRSLADHAVQAGGPGLSRVAFISGALWELGVAPCRGNASLGRSGLYSLTRVSGRAPLRGLSCPSAKVA
jgi:hypothetical protein